jgi:hypothetical protein
LLGYGEVLGLGISYGEPEEQTRTIRVKFDPNLVASSGHSQVLVLALILLLFVFYHLFSVS